MTIQSAIQARLEEYSPSMRRIADVVLSQPGAVTRSTVSALAKKCRTSDATVVRFCRTLGLSGFVDFRVALAGEIGVENRRRFRTRLEGSDGRTVVSGDSLEQIVSTIAFVETLSVEETVANLDMAALKRSVEVLDAASRIFTFGSGGSGSCAEDLQRKLARVGRPAQALRGVEEAIISTSFMTSRDVLIVFSHTGRTDEAVRVAELAASRSVSAIAVTNDLTSPVAKAARFVIGTTVRETTLRAASLGARTAQALVADCLYSALAYKDLDAAQQALKTTGELLASLRGGGRLS